MLKRVLLSGLAVCLVNLFCLPKPVTASSTRSKEQQQTERVRAGIAKLGIGPDARISVKLKDNAKLSGYISEAGDESFVIVDGRTGQPNRVAYPQVAQVKGNNLSSKAKIAITVVVLVILGIVIILATPRT